MVLSTYFAIVAFIYLLVVTIVYFLKSRVKSNEEIIFSIMIITNLFGVIFYFFSVAFAILNISDALYFVVKLLMVYFVFFTSEYYLYCYIIGNPEKCLLYRMMRFKILFLINAVISILVFTLPMEFGSDNHYSYGISTDLVYIYSGIINFITTTIIFRNIRKYKKKKLIPVAVFIVLSIIAVIIQSIYPAEQFMIVVDSVIIFLMYFTLENPDVKMLQEFKIAKDRALKANEEKEMFLYNITGNLRIPLSNVRKACDYITTNTKENNIKDKACYINANTTNMLSFINNVLDITNMEITNIKLHNSKYNTKLVIQKLYKIYSSKVPKGIKMRFNIDSNIPEMLYGDESKIKQLLTILLDNAFKYTDKGFVELNLNTIVKNDVCRLIIKVEDSGIGIKASELDEIFNKDNQMYANLEKVDDNKKNLAIAKSIATLLGGMLLLESEIGTGTKITVVLDQKIYNEKNEKLEELENDTSKYVNKTKVMVVSEDNTYLNGLVKKISKHDVEIEALDLGAKCLEKIRSNNKYDLIIIDEELTKLSALDILNKLNDVRGFDIDVAILTNNPENKGYIKDGFKYVLNRKINTKELDKLINEIE